MSEAGGGTVSETRTKISKRTLEDLSKTVERILSEWHYPNAMILDDFERRAAEMDEGKVSPEE